MRRKKKIADNNCAQRVYCEIIHGNLAETRQEQAYGKCESSGFCQKKLMPLAVHLYISSGNTKF
jgi:hypothetical protein